MKIPNLMMLVSLACVAAISAHALGCASAPSSNLAVEGAADDAEQKLCIKNAQTRADADACRKGVETKYAALMAFDAGSDGGK